MRTQRSVAVLAASLALCAGCLTGPKAPSAGESCPPATQEGPTIRVKAPPQKVVIEQPEYAPPTQPCPPGAPEKKKEDGRPESARQPERERRPEREAAAAPESALGTIGALGQIASLSRTVAMTRPMGTVNPGASAIGVGLRWIHIPLPFPRLFSVEETPSVTVPLSEANLVPFGAAGPQINLGGREACFGGERGLTREELSAVIARELAAQRAAAAAPPPRHEAAPTPPPADDADRKRLEQKLSEAEAQLEKLSKVLKSLDEKIPDARIK